jgi:hypothetical protein
MVEYASSGKAKCKQCKETLEKVNHTGTLTGSGEESPSLQGQEGPSLQVPALHYQIFFVLLLYLLFRASSEPESW